MIGTGMAAFAAQEMSADYRRYEEEAAEWKFEQGSPRGGAFARYALGPRIARPGFRNTRTGEFVEGKLLDVAGGRAKQYHHPHFMNDSRVRSPYVGVERARRKRVTRGIGKFLVSPGVLGLGTGYLLPKIASTTQTLLATTAIAVGGYVAPAGSFMRNFSIGAGVGAGIHSAEVLYGQYKKIEEFVRAIGEPLGKAVDAATELFIAPGMNPDLEGDKAHYYRLKSGFYGEPPDAFELERRRQAINRKARRLGKKGIPK